MRALSLIRWLLPSAFFTTILLVSACVATEETTVVATQVETGENTVLPAFLKKVQLHNFDGPELTEDGAGVELHRIPAHVRKQLNKTSATRMLYPANSEIRFVLDKGEKPWNVRFVLESPEGCTVEFYYGDYENQIVKRKQIKEREEIEFPMYGTPHLLPHGRFSNQVLRMVFSRGRVCLYGIKGNIHPPVASELPPALLSYGTSISEACVASRQQLAWNALTAHMLGYQCVNLGSSGSAFCEAAMADYIATRKWDLCVLELSINMIKDFTVEQFKARVAYFVNTVAKSHPDSPVVCISLFPTRSDTWTNHPVRRKQDGFRNALQAICAESSQKNIHFINGPDLISMMGLTQDILHPSDYGMIEIARNLAPRLQAILAKQRPVK